MMKVFFILLILFVSSSFRVKEPDAMYSISVTITNIRNNKGIMQLQLYRTQKSFAAETPYKTYRFSKKDLVNNTLHYKIEGLSPDNYGVALLDDENGNSEMDYGWIYPTEGFGFSDYYHTAWTRPTFYDFKFYLNEDKAVGMKVRYI